MKNILLICNAGMSTSILVEKMKEEATKQDIEANIWAIADVEVDSHWQKADVILVGPQVSYLKDKIEKKVENTIPVDVIGFVEYGRVDGQAVLNKAQELIGG